MRDFFTGLQFLTRVHLIREIEWSPESFGRSVRYFPLVGAVIGGLLAAGYYLAAPYIPLHLLSALLIVAEIMITGGLHCDGFMDTADGIFSGRSRERMLEIMKDSRVGANGVVAFGILLLVKWSVYLDLPPMLMPYALFISPIIGRLCMVVGITVYPYARSDGIGKAFAQYAGKPALYWATAFTLLLIIPLGTIAIAGFTAAVVFTFWFAGYTTRLLGGLTGDVYGAVNEITEVLVLIALLIAREWK